MGETSSNSGRLTDDDYDFDIYILLMWYKLNCLKMSKKDEQIVETYILREYEIMLHS